MSKPRYRKYVFLGRYQINWIDSFSTDDWKGVVEVADWMEFHICESVGYVVGQTPVGVTLAQSRHPCTTDPNGYRVAGLICIPHVCVTSVERLDAKG
jgi:hypothetical protein